MIPVYLYPSRWRSLFSESTAVFTQPQNRHNERILQKRARYNIEVIVADSDEQDGIISGCHLYRLAASAQLSPPAPGAGLRTNGYWLPTIRIVYLGWHPQNTDDEYYQVR